MPGKRGFCFMDPPRSRELGVENLAVTTPLGIGNFGRFYLVIGRLRFIRFRYRSHIRSISNGMRASRTTKSTKNTKDVTHTESHARRSDSQRTGSHGCLPAATDRHMPIHAATLFC